MNQEPDDAYWAAQQSDAIAESKVLRPPGVAHTDGCGCPQCEVGPRQRMARRELES